MFVVLGATVVSQLGDGQSVFERRTAASSSDAGSYADAALATGAKSLSESSAIPGNIPGNISGTKPGDPGNSADASAAGGSPKACPQGSAKITKAFNADVEVAKKALDDKLSSFQMGINISSMFVNDYNAAVTKLFEEHVAAAAAQNCELLVTKAPTLPATYPN